MNAELSTAVAESAWSRFRARVVAMSATPYATLALCVVAFVDGSVFPIPPFALLIPMVLAQPTRAWRYAVLGTVASLFGGVVGYEIGQAIARGLTTAFTVDIALPIHFKLASWQVDTTLRQVLTRNFLLLAFACSILPTPYKVVAIGAGVVGVPMSAFIIASVLGRSARFFGVSAALVFFGPRALKLFRRG